MARLPVQSDTLAKMLRSHGADDLPVRLRPPNSARRRVLELLLRAEGRIVSAEELLTRVWDENADPFTSSVRVIMSRLRSKLGEPALIETVIGRGYRM